MSFRVADLWRWDGTLDRGPFLFIGLAGFALKHNLDRFLASWIFQRPWGLFNYWIPLDRAVRLTELKLDEALFLGTMVALALPFIYVGVALTVRRLRAVGLPLWLAALFFVPMVNLFFFLLLSVLPSKPAATEAAPAGRAAKFGVVSNPAPMQEWTLYSEVHPPHLDNFLVSRGGRFLLTPLPGGRTRLEGTTWYQHHMWPASYWQLWSDAIIHRIHHRVLQHVKQQAESDSAPRGAPRPPR